MSYLDSPRLHFRGWFQADVSTINNDVRFFQNASFVPEYQQLTQVPDDTSQNNWNPEGTGVFRFLDCNVTSLATVTVQNAANRAPGKLVDLDPQQQMVSQIWGMQIRLVDEAGKTLVQGEFKPAAFTNLWRRQQEGLFNDQQLTAVYQSVLEGVEWFDISRFPLLQQLQAATQDDQLSIDFNLFAYSRNRELPRYTMGRVVGTVGPYFQGEPKQFVRGRQFIYIADPKSFTIPVHGMGNMQAKVSGDGDTVTADFGNSFPMETAYTGLKDIGQVFLGVLTSNPPEVQTTVNADQVVIIGEVPYLEKNWYDRTAGILDFPLTGDARQLITAHPLVVISPAATGSYTVRLQETIDGQYVRADNFVYRMDPGQTQQIEFYADRFGAPIPQATINLSVTGGFMGGAGGGKVVKPITRPRAAIPAIATPADAAQWPNNVKADANGYATAAIQTSTQGPGTPRGYLNGQLYGIGYQLASQPPHYVSNPMNYVSVLAFSKKDVPETPTWYRDIQYLFTQYGNLYPIMGRYVVNLSDYHDVVRRLRILQLAFSLPIEDANHMPVTRDLGEGDRDTILKWFDTKDCNGLPPLGTPSQSPPVPPPIVDEKAEAALPDLLPEQAAGKTAVILSLEKSVRIASLNQKGSSQ
jgi:hypothetical protein